MKFLLFLLIFSISVTAFGQLGFCEGSKGDPIFHEDFGNGNGTGPALAPGTTSYRYITQDPQDGEYTISDEISAVISSWHDYLPNSTYSNGRALIVNADYTAGRFFQTPISGLCENTSYEFSAFLMNIYDRSSQVCENGGIPINVRFEIWDETDTQMLKEGSTGDIPSTISPAWDQYALTFQSKPGQNAVILKMFNNGEGGCGNDLAIDDIIFWSCGDLTTITAPDLENNEYAVCEAEAPVSLTLTATPDNSVYQQHAFQWQQSSNGSDWSDIASATSGNFTTASLSASRYYRVKVAEDAVNLSNNLCSSASEPVHIHIVEKPDRPVSKGDKQICSNEPIPGLGVEVAEGEIISWYDSASGGNLLGNGQFYTPEVAGTFYAEASKEGYDCERSSRTAVKLEIFPAPEVEDEQLQICDDSGLELDAGISGMEYRWSTGQNSQKIWVSSAGNFSVDITTSAGCTATRNFEVFPVDNAEIDEIISEEGDIEIVPLYEGSFEFSLDGNNFQQSNIFRNIKGGVYTAYMRDLQSCKTVIREFPLL